MATRINTPSPIAGFGENATLVTWIDLDTTNDTGVPIEMPGSTVRSIQIGGTFDSATVVIEGSNDGTNYLTLTDPQGNALSKTAAAIEAIQESPRFLRPKVTSAGGSTSIDIHLILVRRGR